MSEEPCGEVPQVLSAEDRAAFEREWDLEPGSWSDERIIMAIHSGLY